MSVDFSHPGLITYSVNMLNQQGIMSRNNMESARLGDLQEDIQERMKNYSKDSVMYSLLQNEDNKISERQEVISSSNSYSKASYDSAKNAFKSIFG